MAKDTGGKGHDPKHDDKSDRNGAKAGGGSGKYENPDKGGKHSGGKK